MVKSLISGGALGLAPVEQELLLLRRGVVHCEHHFSGLPDLEAVLHHLLVGGGGQLPRLVHDHGVPVGGAGHEFGAVGHIPAQNAELPDQNARLRSKHFDRDLAIAAKEREASVRSETKRIVAPYLGHRNLDGVFARWLNGDLCNGIGDAEIVVVFLAKASETNWNLLRSNVSIGEIGR